MNELNHVTYNENGEAMVGEGVGFERIRRITGYLVGTLDPLQQRQACRRT